MYLQSHMQPNIRVSNDKDPQDTFHHRDRFMRLQWHNFVIPNSKILLKSVDILRNKMNRRHKLISSYGNFI